MSSRLLLADADTVRDALTFAGRAARAGADGVRMQSAGGVMRISTATLAPQTLLDSTPTVLGMRILAADPELVCDLVIAPNDLTAHADDDRAISLPEVAISPSWAGIAPPQAGWTSAGTVSAEHLAAIAAHGVSEVAAAVPANSGEDLVRKIRASVWGVMDDTLFHAPRGVAFTADVLGFLADGSEPVAVFRNERWTRFSMARGHIISRGPSHMGLTAIRATGPRG